PAVGCEKSDGGYRRFFHGRISCRFMLFWPLALGPWPLALGPWPLALGPWPLASARIDPVRLDPAHPDGQGHQQDQRHRQADAAGERVDRALAFALVDQQVVEAGAQVPDDEDEEGD